MAQKPIPADIAKLSFEDALAELEAIVSDLETGSNKLDGAIAAYERGTHLKTHCEAKLREAKTRIDKISVGPNGEPKAEPTDLE
ncbi:MAG: exodeoxyribonuclease VII small subunit [Proteobacteria bacterium]|nr:exodeoxyribonuclease VII small subunit [Pseudomonadota bacterium]